MPAVQLQLPDHYTYWPVTSTDKKKNFIYKKLPIHQYQANFVIIRARVKFSKRSTLPLVNNVNSFMFQSVYMP